nr:MAG TPA: hypothetical protein [Caudoviricetes sp.]
MNYFDKNVVQFINPITITGVVNVQRIILLVKYKIV